MVVRDVNRVPGPRDPEKLPEPGFQTTRKLPENLQGTSYSGKETVKKNFYRTIQNINRNINKAKMAKCCNKYVNKLSCT